MQQVFTTSQVALICKVAERTVNKWFDSGRLRGYRITGSQDRRIPREHLIRFLKEHGMSLGELEKEEEETETLNEDLIKTVLFSERVLFCNLLRKEIESQSEQDRLSFGYDKILTQISSGLN